MQRELFEFGEPLAKGMARRTDPPTSHAAAEVVRPHLGKIQQHVLDVYAARGPMSARTAERLPDFEMYGFSTIRKRISELAQSGLLVPVGIDNSGKSPCTIYAVKP